MDKTTQNNLCKGLRACGIPKELCHQLLDTMVTWVDNNGSEWALKRIKDLRQWYETSLTGNPVPPEWFKHGKDMLPLGVWKAVFKLPVAKALGVLSMGTVLYEKHLSKTQEKKFLKGLAGSGTQNLDELKALLEKHSIADQVRVPSEMPKITFPTIFDMNGSVPIHDGRETVRTDNKSGLALKALEESWDSVPQATFDFLDRMGLLAFMPVDVLGNEYQLELNRPHSSIVGKIGVIQEPELKARVVANPNRVLQVTLDPLKEVLMRLVRLNPTDCIYNQEEGMLWVQDQLRQGIELAGSDLTSASDLLDLDGCLMLLEARYGLSRIAGFTDHMSYYREVSRADWYCPALKRVVQWQQGDPLGTGPSIGILSEANDSACALARQMAIADGILSPNIPRTQCYRVLGDDVIMRSELEPYYQKIILALGGEINHSKTLKSNKVAEFAGRIVTPEHVYLKKVKYSEPSDSSFMDYMSGLGDQAKYFLKPKQRSAYEFFKYVPGFMVTGPWMADSYGIPFADRYSWYLSEVEPVLDRVEPDLQTSDYGLELLKAQLSREEAGETVDRNLAVPTIDDGYLPSQVTPSFRHGGDPRLVNGQTTLERLTKAKDSIMPFSQYQSTRRSVTPPGGTERPKIPESVLSKGVLFGAETRRLAALEKGSEELDIEPNGEHGDYDE